MMAAFELLPANPSGGARKSKNEKDAAAANHGDGTKGDPLARLVPLGKARPSVELQRRWDQSVGEVKTLGRSGASHPLLGPIGPMPHRPAAVRDDRNGSRTEASESEG